MTRTYGLSGSGMDIDQMVKDMMKAQRTRYDTLYQKKTQQEWKKADYNTMYNTINDFRSDTVFNYKLQGTLLPKKVTSTDETKVSATANSDAVNFPHTIDVTTLAESASMSSSTGISVNAGADKSKLSTHIGINGAIKLTISDGTTSKDLVSDTTTGTYDTTNKSIYDLVSDINKLGLNVKASYDTTLDRFFLYNTKSGDANQITLSSSDGSATGAGKLTDNLKLGIGTALATKPDPLVPEQTLPSKSTAGKDAAFTLDGVALTQASNTFTLSGITYNLKAQGIATVAVSSDNDKAVAAVKSFIEAYNSILSKVNGEITETYYKDYLPLTSEQKKDMDESDIKQWDERAHSGLLRRDSTLQTLVYSMRNDLSTPVSGIPGKYNSAASIGITTGDYSEGGKLYLDETKLKKALEEDPDILSKLFSTSGDSHAAQGISVRLYDTLKNATDKIYTVAGATATTAADTDSTISKSIKDYEKRMDDLSRRLEDMEDRYYKQFDAMEVALNKMTQQSSWLAQQFSS